MSSQRRSMHGQWSSHLIFILAVVGSAVGFSNIWRFPYLVGEHGGGAFLFAYLMCLAVVGLPLMIAELMLGRRGRHSPINTMRSLALQEGFSPLWGGVGWLAAAAALIMLSVYSVVGGWALAYVFRAASGAFKGADAFQSAAIFQGLIGDPERLLAWHTLFMAVTMMIVARGVRHGLEEAVRWFMPLLIGLLLFLALYAGSSGQLKPALVFLFEPDFGRLTAGALLAALGHAFLTLGLGLGAAMAYGAYAGHQIPLVRASVVIVIADVVIALLAGIAVLPLVFAHGLGLDSGAGLVFQALPLIFGKMQHGVWFGTLFFLLLVFAAWTSAIALLEPVVAYLVEQKGIDRPLATTYLGTGVWALGVVSVFSFNVWEHVRPLGAFAFFERSTVFDLLSFFAVNVLLPITALLIAVFAGWLLSPASSRLELGGGLSWRLWRLAIRFVTPLAVLVVLLHSIGKIG